MLRENRRQSRSIRTCCWLTPPSGLNGYFPMKRGHLYLVAVMDWYSRKILTWRLSNTMDSDFCVDALNDAIQRYGKPRIFNTDQGAQFTSKVFTDVLRNAGILISMDGRGQWKDNVFIERFWRSLKYECVFLNAFETGAEARKGIGSWIRYYNSRRPHSTHRGRTPSQAYDTLTPAMDLVSVSTDKLSSP